jgi:hypothetical protein
MGHSNHGTEVKPLTEQLRLYQQMLHSKCKQEMLVKSFVILSLWEGVFFPFDSSFPSVLMYHLGQIENKCYEI